MKNILISLLIFLGSYTFAQEESVPYFYRENVEPWQVIDPNGLVAPSFTHPFLEEIRTWDTINWEVFEWGCGYSTAWFAIHAHRIVSVDYDSPWTQGVKKYLERLYLYSAQLKIQYTQKSHDIAYPFTNSYVQSINENNCAYNCIIIDGLYPEACMTQALKHIKPGGVIILNHAERFNFELLDQESLEKLNSCEHKSFAQPGEQDWRTDYWRI